MKGFKEQGMKKSLLYAILLAGVLFVMMPTQAKAGTVWGGSLVGYDSQAREIFGYSATWLDYDAAWYYDPAVQGELYWQFDNEVPLDSGSDTGYSDPYWGYLLDAQVWLFSSQYRPVTTYATYSNHFVVPYYYDSYYGYYDPFGFSFFGGGDFGGYYGLPDYGYYPNYYIPSDYEYLFSTGVSIQTPSDVCRVPGTQFDEVGRSCNNPPVVTPTPSDSLSVTLSDIKAVPKNGEVTVNVNITPANNSTAVTLTLATDANTTGSATFDDGTTTRQVTQTTTVKIKGVTESSTRDNISLTATAMDTNRAKVKFSVLWVTLSLRYGNNLEVSADNAAKQNYIQRMGGISHLGIFQDKSSIPMWGPAVEIVGQVTPSNFEGEVKLNRRITAGRLYRNKTLSEREDNAPDNSPFLFDHDPQSGGSNGKVYDIDKPSIGMQHEPGFPVGYIIRKRENFKEWAEFNGMKVSDDLLWFARVSIVKNTEGKDVLEANSVTHCRTDHIAGVGETPLTWNLCAEQPAGFNPIDDARTFVDAHYWDFFGHAPDQGGLDFWTGEITQCGSDAACVDRKRVDVARAFFYSGEFIGMHPELNGPRGTHEYNAAFVRLCYLTYLRREPNAAPDNNFDGFNFWVNHLDSTNPDAGDGKYNGMIHAFLLSTEYRDRFSQ
jgi:Tfp pilus assembly major pilin PilA